MTELDDEQLRALRATVADLAARCTGPVRPPWWHRGPDYGAAYRNQSPFTVGENPRSFGMTISDISDDTRHGVRGRIALNHMFAGPPAAVHGGVLAGLFDEIVGALAGAVAPTAIVATATLKTRFRAPTPLDTPLEIDAFVARSSSQRMRAMATCRANGEATATAEALMVMRTRPPQNRGQASRGSK